MGYGKPQYRVTAWPGPVPLPSYLRFEYVLEERGIGPENTFLQPTVPIEEPLLPNGETYLRLLDLDLDDPSQILAFANEHGFIGMAQCWPPKSFRGEWPWPEEDTGEQVEDAFFVISRRLSAQLRAEVSPGRRGAESLTAFTFGAQCIGDLVRAWRALSEGIDPDWQALPCERAVDVAELLRFGLTSGLESFHPEIVIWDRPYRDEEIDPHLVDLPERGPRLQWPLPFYAIACLELYNHIAENATYRRCANDRCGRLFVRQQGRALHQQHRTKGVLYCTPACASAQAKRAQRQRQKLKKSEQ